MQTRSQNSPLQYEPDINKLICKVFADIREERERAMVVNLAWTLMDYLTPTIGDTNPILLPEQP